MKLVDVQSGVEVLGREECLARLREDVVGRLALVVSGAPALMPVNYVLDGETIVFRSGPGTKVASAGRSRAAFEIDAFDRPTRTGWSVVVTGRLEEVTTGARDFDHLRHLPVDPWAPGEREHWLRLVPDRISGRIIRAEDRTPAPRAASPGGTDDAPAG